MVFLKETHLKNPPQTHDFCFKMFGIPGSKKHELVRIEGRPAIFEASGFLVETSGSRARHRGIYPKFRSHLARWAPTSYTYRSPITAVGPPTLYQVSWTFCLRKSLGKFYEPNRLGIPAQWWLIVRESSRNASKMQVRNFSTLPRISSNHH